MKDKSPSGLNEWLHFLKSKKFPVKKESLLRLQAQITKDDDTLNRMQKNIASEPFIGFAILNKANSIVSNKNTNIKTPFHGVSMVGMNGISKLFSQFTPYEIKHVKQPHVTGFLREVQTSYEAAVIARSWAIQKLTSNEDDVFWVTLFRDSVRWLLWFYAHSTMETLTNRIMQGEKSSQVELEVLGCRIDELTVHMCTFWKTPQSIIDSFLTKHIPTTKELQQLVHLAHHPDEIPEQIEDKRLTLIANSAPIFSYCANKVAREAELKGWDSKTLPFYYRVMAAAMHKNLGEIIHTAHLATREAAILYNLKGKIPLAKRLLDPELYTGKRTVNKTFPIDELKRQLSKVNYETKTKANLTLKTIKKTIPNTQHVIIFKQSNGKISPIFQLGYSIETIKKIKWNAQSNIFKKLSRNKMAAHLNGQKLNTLLKDFPDKADQIIDKNSHLILASTTTSETDTIILWLETRTKFTPKDFQNLKNIVTAISHQTDKLN